MSGCGVCQRHQTKIRNAEGDVVRLVRVLNRRDTPRMRTALPTAQAALVNAKRMASEHDTNCAPAEALNGGTP